MWTRCVRCNSLRRIVFCAISFVDSIKTRGRPSPLNTNRRHDRGL